MSNMIAAAKLEATLQKRGEEVVIEVVGDVDLTTVKTLEVPLTESIQATVDATKAVPLSVDLRHGSAL
ncbi:MAG: hypothetical protein ACRYFS_20880 [Janthinobacterium lividum]